MPQSLSQIYFHLVFSTKGRVPFLRDQVFRSELHAYLIGICKGQDSPSLRIGGVEDHVHILGTLGRTIAVADLVRELKRDSTKWIKSTNKRLAKFAWKKVTACFRSALHM